MLIALFDAIAASAATTLHAEDTMAMKMRGHYYVYYVDEPYYCCFVIMLRCRDAIEIAT